MQHDAMDDFARRQQRQRVTQDWPMERWEPLVRAPVSGWRLLRAWCVGMAFVVVLLAIYVAVPK